MIDIDRSYRSGWEGAQEAVDQAEEAARLRALIRRDQLRVAPLRGVACFEYWWRWGAEEES